MTQYINKNKKKKLFHDFGGWCWVVCSECALLVLSLALRGSASRLLASLRVLGQTARIVLTRVTMRCGGACDGPLRRCASHLTQYRMFCFISFQRAKEKKKKESNHTAAHKSLVLLVVNRLDLLPRYQRTKPYIG